METQQSIDSNRPIHVYFTDQVPPTFHSDEYQNMLGDMPRNILYCTSWEGMSEYLKLHPKSVCVNVRQFEKSSLIETISMFETLANLIGCGKDMTITLGVHRDTETSFIRAAQKTRILGIVPASTDFGLAETMKGLDAQWSGIPYWPRHIIDQLSGAKKIKIRPSSVVLTPRQQQIFDIVVSRGCSNKHIAKLMGISESTVKLHLSNIFKKFSVRNRTQLAVSVRKEPEN